MSRKTQPRKKKYDPLALRRRILRSKAMQCALYYWESSNDPHRHFTTVSPYAPEISIALMQIVMEQPERWIASAVACFVDETNTYYEELVTLPPFGPVALSQYAGAIDELLVSARDEAKASGNPSHYIDSAFVLQLYTPQAEISLEDDDVIKAQASFRADIIFAEMAANQIAKLTPHQLGISTCLN